MKPITRLESGVLSERRDQVFVTLWETEQNSHLISDIGERGLTHNQIAKEISNRWQFPDNYRHGAGVALHVPVILPSDDPGFIASISDMLINFRHRVVYLDRVYKDGYNMGNGKNLTDKLKAAKRIADGKCF